MPTGTVTFLLTDIEQSSRIWERDDATTVESAVARHYEILADAIARRDGARPTEQGEGDSVVGVFARASDAVLAALDAQTMLDTEDWPTSEALRVRMALHTGEAHLRDGGSYSGPQLNRCARLRELAHGGQVLLSGATHDLVADHLPDDVTLKDLRSHRLRDLGRPEHVFQLVHPELHADFPPLRSLDARPHNLPPQLTPFIGREQEMDTVRRLFSSERLVTFTGSGGCGKTRLALQVVAELLDDYPDGVWWIDLAALADPGLVPKAVATAIGIREVPREPMTTTLERVLAARQTMVLLDNCEHVIEACAVLSNALLRACPELSILATSREPLGVEGETTWRVPSLSLPKSNDEAAPIAQSEAVRLFVDRARRARPTFEVTDANAGVVAQICRRLDGIPLAIELAAARIRVLPAEQIAEGLDDRFRLLTGGARTAVPRQRALEASVDWSYDLLDEQQRTLFRRLSVFAGSFALDGAEAVCSRDGLEAHVIFDLLLQLVDRSLVQVQDEGPRYRLLETIRQYARHKLVDAGEADAVRSRHLDHYTEIAEHLTPLVEWGATLESLASLDLELDNMRAAMDWASTSGSGETPLRLAIACTLYWVMRGHFIEGRGRTEASLPRADPGSELQAQALVGLSTITHFGMDFGVSIDFAERALTVAREIGDRRLEGRALLLIGMTRMVMDVEGAAAPLSEALDAARESGDAFSANGATIAIAGNRVLLGDGLGALEPLAVAAADARASGALFLLSPALYWHATAHLHGGRLADAERDLREGREVAASIGDRFWGNLMASTLGVVLGFRGDHQTGRELLDECLHDATETGNVFALANWTMSLPWLERSIGDVEATAAAAEAAVGLARSMAVGNGWAWAMVPLAWAEMRGGNTERASTLLEGVLDDVAGTVFGGWTLAERARLARHLGKIAVAGDLARRCLLEAGPDDFVTTDALETLAGALTLSGEHQEAARLFGAADAARSERGQPRWSSEEAGYQSDVAVVRDALGADPFTVLWEEGAALSAEEAVALATRGHGTRGRPSSGWSSLTPTELDVIKLVAEGLTNPQIAEKLFVSPRTVQGHLRRIFPKLGVSTRSELAALAARREA